MSVSMVLGRKLAIMASVFLAGLAIAIYWPGFAGGFFFDDGPNIVFAKGIRLETLSFESIQQALLSGGAGPLGRPVAQLSFALNYYVSGLSPFSFKATNLAIHMACGILVFALTRKLLISAEPLTSQRNILISTAAVTAIWLLHPIQVLPVLHVVQRMTSLSALFLLAALLLHILGRERPGHSGVALLLIAWCVLWPLSLLSKETGVLFPVFTLAWELLLRRNANGTLDRFTCVMVVIAVLLLIAGLALAISPKAQWLWAGYEMRSFSMLERVMTEGRVIWLYISLMVIPRLSALGLYHDDFAISTSLNAPWTTLPALLGIAGLIILGWRLRKSAPIIAFGIAWFLIGHVLESTVLPLEIAHEHRNYLPLYGVALAAGWVLLEVEERHTRYRKLSVVIAALMLVGLALLTAVRAQSFGNDLQRTLLEAEHHPASSYAQHEAAVTLASLPQASVANSETYVLARHHFELALALNPHSKMGLLGLIDLDCRAGLPPQISEVNELKRRLKETKFAPGDRTVLYNLKEMSFRGSPCLGRTEVDGLFAAALANSGVSLGVQAMILSWQADYLWLHEGNVVAARNALARSLSLNSANLSNRLKWAQLLIISGDHEQARNTLNELKSEKFASEERQTLNELMAVYKIK
jgi:hypothetical protein